MRLLLDHNISPKVAGWLRTEGYDVTVARDVGLSAATDHEVMAVARAENRVLVSAGTDFGAILARTAATSPSFVLIRRAANERPAEQAALLLDNLPLIAEDVQAGAIVVLGDRTLRIRSLPIG